MPPGGRIADRVVQQNGEHLGNPLLVTGNRGHGRLRQCDGERDLFFRRDGGKSFVEVER